MFQEKIRFNIIWLPILNIEEPKKKNPKSNSFFNTGFIYTPEVFTLCKKL